MTRLPLVLLALFLAACPDKRAAEPATPAFADNLAERVAATTRKAFPSAAVTVEGPNEVLVKQGDYEATIGLDNIRLRCTTAEACDDAIGVAVKNVRVSAPGADEKFDPKMIRLTMKTTRFLSGVDAMMKEKLPEKFEKNRVPRTAFVADVVVIYVLDSETGMQIISQQDLDENGLSLEQVSALAQANLAEAFPELTPMQELSAGLYSNTDDDNYASALLVLPALWAPLEKQLGAPLLVAAPARNRLFAVSGKNQTALPAFRNVVAAALESEDHSLSGAIFEWTPKGFREWK